MFLRQINDPALAQYAYLIGCPQMAEALVIDPQRDIDRYRALARTHDLRITAVAETHIHADFVSGSQEFAADSSVTVYLSGEGGDDWSYKWPRGRGKVILLRHGMGFRVGSIEVTALHTPGHTPEHLSYLITDSGSGADAPMALIAGDFLFVGDVGRPDLLETALGGSGIGAFAARQLQKSLVERLAELPDFLQILRDTAREALVARHSARFRCPFLVTSADSTIRSSWRTRTRRRSLRTSYLASPTLLSTLLG